MADLNWKQNRHKKRDEYIGSRVADDKLDVDENSIQKNLDRGIITIADVADRAFIGSGKEGISGKLGFANLKHRLRKERDKFEEGK